ncbi:hypothetical protein KFK09_001417 [Dendrobium nobile]|uniref:Uncharacterized protein n=1 Tax=Dendrobium nobile TaxID=94219 RepID=A0A8T3C838_DENNO|nr:hypothetical protein KFK09_001417 [Dendrobium nobile]
MYLYIRWEDAIIFPTIVTITAKVAKVVTAIGRPLRGRIAPVPPFSPLYKRPAFLSLEFGGRRQLLGGLRAASS